MGISSCGFWLGTCHSCPLLPLVKDRFHDFQLNTKEALHKEKFKKGHYWRTLDSSAFEGSEFVVIKSWKRKSRVVEVFVCYYWNVLWRLQINGCCVIRKQGLCTKTAAISSHWPVVKTMNLILVFLVHFRWSFHLYSKAYFSCTTINPGKKCYNTNK